MKELSSSLLFTFFSIAFCLPTLAQNDSINIYNLSIEELMSLEVEVASLVETDLKKQPVSFTTISRDQLVLSGARTLADALSMFVPGLFVVEDQDDVIVGFRGLAPDNNSKVMIMVNGQNLNIEWFWGPPPSLLNTTHFQFIEKVEVIRGPGSVTLGQGALLGVINIVTSDGKTNSIKSAASSMGTSNVFIGMNEFWGVQADVSFSDDKSHGYFYLGRNEYGGQTLRNQGWANDKTNEGYKGGSVINIGTRLKRSSNTSFVGNYSINGFGLDILLADHKQDLYNFYRDRNKFGETLISLTPSFQHNFTENFGMKATLNAAVDNFALQSVDGYTMGGTRENRYGSKIVFNVNELFPRNRLAVGIEFRRFEFGKSNFSGNNFISNVVSVQQVENSEAFYNEANLNKIWGYKANINVLSLFAEDFYSVSQTVDLFAGLRFDNHPNWGSNITPRIGTIVYPSQNLRFRLSYQTGFRGAVGLHYGGGYRQDGLLSELNFSQIVSTSIPIFDENGATVGFEENLPKTQPESMQGFEIAGDWDINPNFNFYCVGFYNIISNVIDVGVIWRNPEVFQMTNIGTDIPGDWNGYWFFKNTQGQIVQSGFESVFSFKSKKMMGNVSHSFVKVINSSEQQRGSMYLTSEGNFKAYPENVTRVNVIGSVTPNFSVGFNYAYYYFWYSPNDQKVNANHLLNIAASYKLFKKLDLTASLTNLLNQTKLYPMNSNVGDVELSDGTPSVENTSVWLSVRYNF